MEAGVFYGIVAMICWGVSDFIQTFAIRRLGASKAMVIRNILTLIVSLVAAGALICLDAFVFDLRVFAIVAVSSLVYVVGYFAYVRGFEVGDISLVSPVASSFAIITVLLSVIFANEVLSFADSLCILFIVGGLFLAATNLRRLHLFRSQRGLKEAVIAMFGFGVAFFIMGFISSDIDIGTVFVYSALSQSILFIVIGVKRQGVPKLEDIDKSIVVIFLSHSLIVNLAWVAYIIGSSVSNVSVVAPIASVYSGVTVILAIIINRERIVLNQIVGILAILGGVFLLSQ